VSIISSPFLDGKTPSFLHSIWSAQIGGHSAVDTDHDFLFPPQSRHQLPYYSSVIPRNIANLHPSNLTQAASAYTTSKTLDPTSQTPLTSLAIISQLQGNTRHAIKLYHQALSLNPQDPMTTVLLEMALREQVETLGPESIEYLPEGLKGDIDAFNRGGVQVSLILKIMGGVC
jgi:hypothetical protein